MKGFFAITGGLGLLLGGIGIAVGGLGVGFNQLIRGFINGDSMEEQIADLRLYPEIGKLERDIRKKKLEKM